MVTAYRWLLVGLLLVGCTPATVAPPTADLTAEAQAAAAETEAAATQAAEQAEQLQAEQTAEAAARLATRQANSEATATAGAANVQATREARTLGATAQAQPMADVVLDLYGQGYIGRTGGEYYTLPDFDETWAQIDWYQWSYTDHSPTNFLIRADASWDSASDTANWFNSGCGFVFREQDVDNHYMAYLGLDGNVYMIRWVRGAFAFLGSSYYGKLSVPAGDAHIMLAVDGPDFTFFVNDTKVHSRRDSGLSSGNLALTLNSGTNKGYGTHCRMTNIELWVLQ